MVKVLRKSEIVKKTVEPAIKFIKEVKPTDKVVILYHNDCDGCCSAAVTYMIIKKIAGVTAELMPSDVIEYAIKNHMFKKVAEDASHLIVLDFPTFKVTFIEEIGHVNTLVIDHHLPVDMRGATYCNPRTFDLDIYMPTSYLLYRIYKKLFRRRDVCWIAATGALGDYDISYCTDLFKELKKMHPELLGRFKLSGEVLYEKSLLGKIVKIIDAARIVGGDDGAELATRVLINVENYNHVLNGAAPETKQLMSFFEKSEGEVNRLIKDFKVNSKRLGRILFYKIASPLPLRSTLATRIQKRYDAEVIVLAQKKGNIYKVGLRRGKKSTVDLNSLIKDATSKIPNSHGGGHPQAAAGSIPVGYLDAFLEVLRESNV